MREPRYSRSHRKRTKSYAAEDDGTVASPARTPSSSSTSEHETTCNSSSSSDDAASSGLMNAPRDEMKLGVSYGSLEECSGSSGSSLTTAWSASCKSRRNREMRMAVRLRGESIK